MKQNFENLRHHFLTTPPLGQIFCPIAVVSGSQNIRLKDLIRKGFLNQKRNEFLKIIIWSDI